ncbi:RNA-directed DNA polymerase [Thermoflexibacter ruber]|uniref:Reverse transcriptase (RNA-dependent DNA polymerase) n=1 Tax=Thermoflexibacter ruber TaxID=1003 RepID=A0A1I2FFZ5_9BACT|nr:RNA-directed DNA polymerase [Thermoflexibacter ruber]SFF03446.1 Reverse transcriptase (RNA-dependent DNA polymerase) [Thermoflexibacter ruber]
MKRVGNLLHSIADTDNLRLAVWKAGKGKRYSRQVLDYSNDLEINLLNLQSEILSGKVSVGNYRYFKVYEPKERQICASAFSEQVLHHALMNVCHPYFERYQVYESYASRKGKGVYAALEKAQHFTQKHTFFLKLDVKKFFDSIHHSVLKSQLAKRFKDKRLLQIFYQIIDSYAASPDRGVPIGNLTSQYFANHYLAGLDHFIKENLQCKNYVRYMDDMVLWHDSKEFLKEIKEKINDYIETNLKCTLKPTLLNFTSQGLPFLGYRLFPTHVKLLHKSKIRFIHKINRAKTDFERGLITESKYQQKILPLLSFIFKANTLNFRKSLSLGL